MGPTPFYGARAEKKLPKADFAMKQTNICRLSGDIIIYLCNMTTFGDFYARKMLQFLRVGRGFHWRELVPYSFV